MKKILLITALALTPQVAHAWTATWECKVTHQTQSKFRDPVENIIITTTGDNEHTHSAPYEIKTTGKNGTVSYRFEDFGARITGNAGDFSWKGDNEEGVMIGRFTSKDGRFARDLKGWYKETLLNHNGKRLMHLDSVCNYTSYEE